MKRTKAGKLLCLGMAALLVFPPVPQMTVRAEKTAVQAEESEVQAEEESEVQTEEESEVQTEEESEVQTEEAEVQNAESASEDFKYTELEDGTLEITKYTGSAVEVIIPAEIDGKSVTRIGDDAFFGCSGLTSIKIPSGVTSIGDDAFYACSSLTSIEIPSGVTSIENGVFGECSGLTSIEIPSGVTSIGVAAFSGCSGLTSIEIPSGVTSIGTVAFRGCSGLTSIEIPSGVTSIENGVFEECSGLTSIEIPSGVTSISRYAFYGCSGLTSIKIPSGVMSIGDDAFSGCDNLVIICDKDSYAHTYAEENDIAYQNHEYISEMTTAPTCTETGVKTYTCSICGDTYTEEIAATGHTYTSAITTKPTCTKAGVRTYTCSKCKATYTESVAATGHTEVADNAVAATCTTTGKTAGSHCSVCGTVIVKQETVAKLKHSYKTTIKKATVKKNGSVVKKCKKCGKKNTSGSYTIYRPKSIKLSKTSVTYTGKAIKPKVTVTDKAGKKINKKYYTVTYKNNVKPGKATVTVQFKGKYYKGKLTKSFTIHPKKTSISTINASASNAFTVSWNRPGKVKDNCYYMTDSVTGYQIQYAANKNFKNAKSIWVEGEGEKTKDIVIEDYTTMQTKYYFRIRAYKTEKVNGKKKKFYSAWSSKKEATTEGIVWRGPYPLYTILFDEKGWPYFYGKAGGSANMDADNLAKTEECSQIISNYMHELYSDYVKEHYSEYSGGYSLMGEISFEGVGYYSDMYVVRRFPTNYTPLKLQ